MSDINEIRLKKAIEIEIETLWDCHEHEYFSQEHIEKCLDEMLAMYISDERNYVVDYAEIECTEMCDTVHRLEYTDGKTILRDTDSGKSVMQKNVSSGENTPSLAFLLGTNLDMDKVRKLYALHAKEANDNGIRYATVVDRTCLRDVKEGTEHFTSPIEGELSSKACIVSCGNCGILKESDINEIEKRITESARYGTCYSLIKPVAEWVNPLCAESVSGNCSHTPKDVMSGSGLPLSMTSSDRTDHHKTMKFDTKYGLKEGLTMLSTLLCTRGGVITIKVHGQIYLESTTEDEQTIGFQFTLKQVRDCGWNITEEELNRLNRAMQTFGVTSKVSAYMMLVSMLSESGNCSEAVEAEGWLKDAIDSGDTNEIEAAWARYKAAVEANGGNVGDYGWWERGAGYMQLTHEGNQKAFLRDILKDKDKNVTDDEIDEIINKIDDIPTYIGKNYPIESAVWYWTNIKLPDKDSLNQYVEDYVNDDNMDGIFIITQYYVNGFPNGHGNALTEIRKGNGKNYEINGKKLEANGDSFDLPNGWADRETKWKTAKNEMNKE